MGDVMTELFAPGSDRTTAFVARSLPRPQPRAARTVLDFTEFFGETSGGIRTYLTEKARYVERSRHLRQSIVVPGPRDDVSETRRVRCYRVGSFPIPGQAPYRFMLDRATTVRIVRHERPDIVELGSAGFAPWHVIDACAKLDIPLVSFFHSNIPRLLGGASAHPTVGQRARTAILWRYLRRIDRVLARTMVASRCMAAELVANGITNIAHVPLGVDLEQFRPTLRPEGRELYRALYPVLGTDDRPIVLFVGRFAAEKRLDLLLRAWPRVAARTGAVLVLAGDGPLRQRLLEQYAHDDVRWLGFVSDRDVVARLLAAADAVVSPGDHETFGLAALEAIACGTPVISADAGGTAELIADSGGGVLFPAGDSYALAESLEHLLGAGRAQFGRAGRRHAERHNSWPAVFASVFNVYDTVLSDRA